VANALLVVLLAPRFGPVGAAFASTVAYGGIATYVVLRFRADTGATYADILAPKREDVEVILRTVKQVLARA
jgi:hypothetical protein